MNNGKKKCPVCGKMFHKLGPHMAVHNRAGRESASSTVTVPGGKITTINLANTQAALLGRADVDEVREALAINPNEIHPFRSSKLAMLADAMRSIEERFGVILEVNGWAVK